MLRVALQNCLLVLRFPVRGLARPCAVLEGGLVSTGCSRESGAVLGAGGGPVGAHFGLRGEVFLLIRRQIGLKECAGFDKALIQSDTTVLSSL